jgi:outer membrane protein assembly factor BamA
MRNRGISVLACSLVLVILARAQLASGIEGLEAEEDISDLLPTKFPVEPGEDVSRRRWAVLPQFGFGPDTGVLFGTKFTHRDLYESGTSFDLGGTYALRGQETLAFSIASPNLLDHRFLVLLRALYHRDPQREFFGLGNVNLDGPVSTHEFQELGGALTIGWRPFERVAFNFQVGIRQVDVRNGERDDSIPLPNTTPEKFPSLPGVEGGVVNPIALSLVWNTRDDVMRPTRGWRILLKVLHTNEDLFSDFEFTRFLFDAGYLRAFNGGRQVVGLRVDGEWIEAPLKRVPFWELSELGGRDTLRGFFPHRFVGKARALVNAEIRSRLFEFAFFQLWRVRLDGVLFGDGGRVFLDDDEIEDEFNLDDEVLRRIISDFQYSYGGGLRIALSDALVARLDVGFSEEESGLVYLSFGHTF